MLTILQGIQLLKRLLLRFLATVEDNTDAELFKLKITKKYFF